MNREEFIAQVKREQEALRGFLLALCCGNRDDADDIAQDALVKAYIASTDFKDQAKFRSWLFKIAHNTFLNHVASRRTLEPIEEADGELTSTSADAAFEHQDLYLALRTLPPKERSAMIMFYLNDYSIKEIARITDSSENAVKKQLSRGRDKLKARLKE